MDPRTKYQFSLRRLLIAVTIISSVLALTLAFPIAIAELVTVNLLLIAPAGIVFGIAFWLSKNRRRTSIIMIAGIVLGWFLAPKLFVSWSGPPTFWDRFRVDFDTIGVFMFGGAFTAAFLDFIVTRVTHNPKAKQRRITK